MMEGGSKHVVVARLISVFAMLGFPLHSYSRRAYASARVCPVLARARRRGPPPEEAEPTASIVAWLGMPLLLLTALHLATY
jgi:hypothetical protein